MADPNPTTQTTDRTGDESPPSGSLSRRQVLQSSAALAAALAAGSGAAQAQDSGNGNDISGDDLVWSEVGVNPNKPAGIDFDPQGRLWIVNQEGEIEVADPETGESTTALTISVFNEFEHGAVGIAVDPDFDENNWIYIFYSPPESELDPSFGGAYNQVSRFEVDGDQIDPNSEEEIIRIPNQREQPFHIGGGLDFGPEGALHIGLGDNTHALQNHVSFYLHDGDEANTGDSRGTAMDTSDLRGSILRIVPEDDGSYSIPDEGNLFSEDEYASEIQDGTVRPEIYAMGFRNPFKIDVDDETGWVFGSGQSTQANNWDETSGPPGLGPVFGFTEPGVLGWPMFRGAHPYMHPDGEDIVDEYSHLSGQVYDTDGPINASPRNDGLRELPPIDEDATLAYAPAEGTEDQYLAGPNSGPWDVPDQLPYPELTDYSPITGALIRTDDTAVGGLPDHYDGTLVFAMWNTGDIFAMSIDDNGDMVELEPFLTDLPNGSFTDAAMGPDNCLYIVDWGEANFDPADPTIYRIEHDPDAEPPVAAEFELEGEVSAWTGVSPSSIEGEENPTLDLEPGQNYRVEWTNTDGIGHNFAIRDADEEVLLSTDFVDTEGETQTVEFTATEEMDHYVCQPHPTSMRGGIGESDDDEPEREDNLGDPEEEITVGMTGGNVFTPQIAHIEEGGTVTWEFQGGQPHNTVAYHPDTNGDQQRIPDGTEPWESDVFSSEGATFERTFEEPGVYDYACTPHESAGMVGSVVVGWPDPDDEPGLEPVSDSIPDGAREVLAEDNEYIREVLEDGESSLEVNGYEPQDSNGDGLYNDFTGSGQTTTEDVVAFFENLDHETVQGNVGRFDFNGNDAVGASDVITLFESI